MPSALAGQRESHFVQCHVSVVLAPLIVLSSFELFTAPHDGQTGGGVDRMEFSGMDARMLQQGPVFRRDSKDIQSTRGSSAS